MSDNTIIQAIFLPDDLLVADVITESIEILLDVAGAYLVTLHKTTFLSDEFPVEIEAWVEVFDE